MRAQRGNPSLRVTLDGDCRACPRALDPRVASLLAMTGEPCVDRQKLSGCSTTGTQRALFTTDRNDWLDAWWLVELSVSGGEPKISCQSFMLSIAPMKLSSVRSRPALSSTAMTKLAADMPVSPR